MGTTTQMPTVDATGARMDVGDIPAEVWNVTQAVGMAAGLFWMLATGRMLTRSQHNEIVSDKDKRIDLQDKTIESLTGSVQKQTVNSDLTVSLLRSIDKTAHEKSGGA